jgi:hypothetical protein
MKISLDFRGSSLVWPYGPIYRNSKGYFTAFSQRKHFLPNVNLESFRPLPEKQLPVPLNRAGRHKGPIDAEISRSGVSSVDTEKGLSIAILSLQKEAVQNCAADVNKKNKTGCRFSDLQHPVAHQNRPEHPCSSRQARKN